MGGQNTKIKDPKANVINEVEIQAPQVNIKNIELMLVVITIAILANICIKLYVMHKKSLKREFKCKANFF